MTSRSGIFPKCLICDQILVRPRIFVCGHSLCELCACQNDQFTRQVDVRMMRKYQCPLCRTTDYRSWHKRPINYQLDDFVRIAYRKKYETRLAEIRQEVDDMTTYEEKEQEDLSVVVRESRHSILEHLKAQITPQLRDCAYEGSASIAIDDQNLVRSARKVTKELAEYLFERGVHRLLVTREEIQIQLISTSTFQSEFINPRDREASSSVRLWSTSRPALPRIDVSGSRHTATTEIVDLTGEGPIENPFASTDVYSSSLRRLDEILPRRLTEEP